MTQAWQKLQETFNVKKFSLISSFRACPHFEADGPRSSELEVNYLQNISAPVVLKKQQVSVDQVYLCGLNSKKSLRPQK